MRIVITGWGCLTALGHSADATWQAIQEGKSGVRKIESWDSTDWEFNLAAEIPQFDPRNLISDRKLLKLLSKQDVIGLNAVAQAIEHSQILAYRDSLANPTEINESTGVYVSSPGSKFHQQYDFFPLLTHANGDLKKFGNDLNSIVHPMWLLRTLPNNVLAYTGIQYGFKGANQNIVNHSVGGSQAIMEAAYAMQRGAIKRAVVVGYDTMTEPQFQTYYASLGVLTKTSLNPFDENREGTVLGEGSGALILETLEAAQERGAKIYGEILNGTSITEGLGVFPIKENGEGLVRVLQETMEKASLSASDIGLITAHGNGTILSDAVEANVIGDFFPNQEAEVTAFKWALGHTFAGAGIIETILTLRALQEKKVPGIATLKEQAKDCQKIRVHNQAQSLQEEIALVINRGFASICSCLALTANVQ